MITADLLRAAGMTMTGVGIDELDHALTTGPPHGRDDAQAAARIEFTAAGAGQPGGPVHQNVPLPRRRRGLSRLFCRHPQVRLAAR